MVGGATTLSFLADAGWGHMSWGWGGFVMMFGFWLLVIGGVFLVSRGFGSGQSGRDAGRRSAREILDERFARGEIDGQEYRERISVLDSER